MPFVAHSFVHRFAGNIRSGQSVLDSYCASAGLAVELDGDEHANQDATRHSSALNS